MYYGHFYHNMLHGIVEKKTPNGYRLIGEWTKGKPNGKVSTFEEGVVFNREYKMGEIGESAMVARVDAWFDDKYKEFDEVKVSSTAAKKQPPIKNKKVPQQGANFTGLATLIKK